MSKFDESRKRVRYSDEGSDAEWQKPFTYRKRFHHNVEMQEEKKLKNDDKTSEMDKWKPSYDEKRLQFKIDAFVKEVSYFYRTGIKECLAAQAEIKDRQIENRDQQIRLGLHGSPRDERQERGSLRYSRNLEGLNREMGKSMSKLDITIVVQDFTIKRKYEEIAELEEKIAEREEKIRRLEQQLADLRGQALAFRSKE